MITEKIKYVDDNVILINNKKFKRLYYNLKIKTPYFINKRGLVYSIKTKRFIKPQKNKYGYYVLHLHVDGKTYTSNLHRCVATVWKPKGFDKNKDVDHVDGDKDNNKSSNLEWVSKRVNIKRAYENGLKRGFRGDESPATRYSDNSVRKAFQIVSEGGIVAEASEKSGIPKSYLYTMLRNEIRHDIFNEFDFSKSKINLNKRMKKEERSNLIKSVQKMYSKGYSAKEVAEEFNVGINFVYNNCRHKIR